MKKISIKYNNKTYNLENSNDELLVYKKNKEYKINCENKKYNLYFTYEEIEIIIELKNTNILQLYVILQYIYKVHNLIELSKLEWNYNNWFIEITPNENKTLPDHLILLNYFLNLQEKFNKPITVDEIMNYVKLRDRRGIGGERPRELNYKYGFLYYTSSIKKSLKNSERLFICPFPIGTINPERKAITEENNEVKCFTCGCKKGEKNIFGNVCNFENGHLIPMKVENTTKSYNQCKWCNTFYKDKIIWDINTKKPKFNIYAIMRDTSKNELIKQMKNLGIKSTDFE